MINAPKFLKVTSISAYRTKSALTKIMLSHHYQNSIPNHKRCVPKFTLSICWTSTVVSCFSLE